MRVAGNWKWKILSKVWGNFKLRCDIGGGGAIWSQGGCIFLLDEERFRSPESARSQDS